MATFCKKMLDSVRERFFGSSHSNKIEVNKAPLLLPMRLTLIYLIITILLYNICPFKWVTARPVLFYGLLVAYLVAFWGGYRLGVFMPLKESCKWKNNTTCRVVKVLPILLTLDLILYVINMFRNYGFQTFDFVGLLTQMMEGVRNPGYGYNVHLQLAETLNGSDVIGGYFFTFINYIWAFFKYPVLISSMLLFPKLNHYGKAIASINIILMVFYYLSIGTNIDILTVFLLVELPIILNTFSLWNEKRITKKHIIKLLCSLAAGFLILACYFTWMMVSRGGINNYDKPEYNVGGIGIDIGQSSMPEESSAPEALSSQADTTEESSASEALSSQANTTEESFAPEALSSQADTTEESSASEASPSQAGNANGTSVFRVPPIVQKFWVSGTSYLTQGYYAFSQALEYEWTPMFGLGSNMFVVDFISDHLYDIDQFTYQVKLEEIGWDSDVQWHTMFTWLANDVSFYGVIPVMFIIGLLLAAMFKDAIVNKNLLAKIAIFYFILMILFIPCNNQIGQRPETLFSFVLVIAWWIVSKFRSKPIKKRIDKPTE